MYDTVQFVYIHLYKYNMYCNVYTWNYFDTLKTLCKHIFIYLHEEIQYKHICIHLQHYTNSLYSA